jgi:hypothetical protein
MTIRHLAIEDKEIDPTAIIELYSEFAPCGRTGFLSKAVIPKDSTLNLFWLPSSVA